MKCKVSNRLGLFFQFQLLRVTIEWHKEDRIEFKLYAAEQHLNNLKRFEQEGSNMRSFKERIYWEMEIEPFMFHIGGSRDSLLVRINDKLGLKLKEKNVTMKTIEDKLTQINEQSLLTDLKNLNCDNYFRVIKKSRNQSIHRSLINVLFRHNICTGESGEPQVFFVLDLDKDLEVVPFMEASWQKVKELIQDIIKKDPSLKL